MRWRTALGIAGALALAVASPAPALARAAEPADPGAAGPRIVELRIVVDGLQVLASFRLDDGVPAGLLERIESGLPTGLAYELELACDRKRWWDAELEAARLEVVAMFNAVTREYLVNTKLEGKLVDSRTLRDTGDLERAMTVFTALPVFTIDQGCTRERYLVRARVELGTGQWLGFVPVLRTSDWVESNKVRVRDVPER
jgi:hypothetical protein